QIPSRGVRVVLGAFPCVLGALYGRSRMAKWWFANLAPKFGAAASPPAPQDTLITTMYDTPMTTMQLTVQRFSVVSASAFDVVVARLDTAIGHPDMGMFRKEVAAAKTYAELEQVVRRAVGPSDLMEFARFDLGEILRKERGDTAPRILRLVAGNPLIMKQMVEHVPDAGSYAPVTILIDERSDGVHLSYDRMASLLVPYGSAEALQVARDL